MSGWHRLWVFISVLLLLVAIAFGWLIMPRTDQGVLRNLETAECKYLTTLPEGFELVERPKFDHPCYSLAYLRWTITRRISNASDYKSYLREKQYRFLGIIFLVWAGVCGSMYALGWSVGWVIRGFRRKDLSH